MSLSTPTSSLPTSFSPEMTPITPQTYEDMDVPILPRMNILASFSDSDDDVHCSTLAPDQLEPAPKLDSGELKRVDAQGRLRCQTSDYERMGLIATGQWCEVYCASPRRRSGFHNVHRRRSDSGVAELGSPSTSRPHQDGSLVAIKSPNSVLARSVLESEAKILSYLSDIPGARDSVVSFLGFDPTTWSLVLEYAPRTLEIFCHPSGLDVAALRQVSQQLVSGLSFLHAANVIHGDIKPSNILLRENLTSAQLIYCDFSSSWFDSPSSEMPESAGTYEYMAPEEIKVDSMSTKASDVYSLGMTLLTAASGRSIYGDAPNRMILRAYAASGTPLDFNKGNIALCQKLRDSGLYQALRLVLTRTPDTRCSVMQWQAMTV